MHATFLLGVAGTGKTYRCLDEVREALKRSAEGSPLLFLAPRQATYQIERELLSDPDLHGYTRLQVLSFDRLARLVLSWSRATPVLSTEGRVMVLRALLTRHHRELKVFHSSARLPGFAQHLSTCIAELQDHRIAPETLLSAAEGLAHNAQLADKLRDVALLFSAYRRWLERERLHDAGHLLDLAADSVRREVQRGRFRWEAIWLDGFTELTPQELTFLLAVVSGCERATLAFCADALGPRDRDWLSMWSVAGGTAARVCAAVQALPGCSVAVETLARRGDRGRFVNCPPLAHVEANWESPRPANHDVNEIERSVRLVSCANPEAEAEMAAQEILRHVRAGGRFRDCGVIVRDLAGYHDAIRRVFRRYEVSFFIDRREPVSHHPLPELARSALRLAAFEWQLDDWLCVMKTGLLTEDDSELDRLENEALERGWSGKTWLHPFTARGGDAIPEALERLREQLVPPFRQFTESLRRHPAGPSGLEVAEALERLWEALKVARRLEAWSAEEQAAGEPGSLHPTVWEQMQDWAAGIGLAFGDERLELREWIAVVDAGLSGFTVGVVPPALDQVLVGAVDRSRNPNLELAIILGLNETVFPAPQVEATLLTERDREELESRQISLGSSSRSRAGRERYHGYIACTRARRRLVLSSARFDAMGQKLNPSMFISRVERMFPALKTETWKLPETWPEAEHPADLLRGLIGAGVEVPELPGLEALRARVAELRAVSLTDRLSPTAAVRLYGQELRTSITSLEAFGQCPFKFFVHSGLRAQERKLFQVDNKKLGDFQHRVLKAFHDQLKAESKRWRDIDPSEARQRIARLCDDHARNYNHGLFATSARQRFAVKQLSLALQEFIEVIVGWMEQYAFDPEACELRFAPDGDVPAWRLELSGGRSLVIRGSIDRVDIYRQEDGTGWCVVLDFKSSRRKIEPILLRNGVQMQLPGYLNVLRRLNDPEAAFGVSKLRPAGLFYVSLRGASERGEHRNEVLARGPEGRRKPYRHVGRFDVTALEILDSRKNAEQFQYVFKKDGALDSRYKDATSPEEFMELLNEVEARAKDFGERIFAGEARVAPYRKGSEIPCEWCDYRPICRIDPWTHQYRTLESTAET